MQPSKTSPSQGAQSTWRAPRPDSVWPVCAAAGRLLSALSRIQQSLHSLVAQVQGTSHTVAQRSGGLQEQARDLHEMAGRFRLPNVVLTLR